MQRKLMHSPIAFAEFCTEIVCTVQQSYNITELKWKLKKKLVKTKPNSQLDWWWTENQSWSL